MTLTPNTPHRTPGRLTLQRPRPRRTNACPPQLLDVALTWAAAARLRGLACDQEQRGLGLQPGVTLRTWADELQGHSSGSVQLLEHLDAQGKATANLWERLVLRGVLQDLREAHDRQRRGTGPRHAAHPGRA